MSEFEDFLDATSGLIGTVAMLFLIFLAMGTVWVLELPCICSN